MRKLVFEFWELGDFLRRFLSDGKRVNEMREFEDGVWGNFF